MVLRRLSVVNLQQNRRYKKYSLATTPFIAYLNPIEEYIVIHNPSSHSISLDGYFIHDENRFHHFTFPRDTNIPPLTDLYLYTTPALVEDESVFKEPYVLWRNHDGSYRKKEVLNNGKIVNIYLIVMLLLELLSNSS